MAGPGDVARDGRQVPGRGRRVLALLVRLLDTRQLEAVVVEDDHELRVEICSESLSMEYLLVLLQEKVKQYR